MSNQPNQLSTADGAAQMLCTEIQSTEERHGSRHEVSFELSTMTRQQAEALQLAFIEWLQGQAFTTVTQLRAAFVKPA